MQSITADEYHLTSVSLRPGSKRCLRAARKILDRNGVKWSDSELLQEVAKVFLRHWRGNGLKSATARRYNVSVGPCYIRMAWYVNKVLYSVLWQRAIHSGESISRMLDFSIRTYMPRLLEEILRSPRRDSLRSQRNWSYWNSRFHQRHKPQQKIFVTYQCKTEYNEASGLKYLQEYRVLTKNRPLAPACPLPDLTRR